MFNLRGILTGLAAIIFGLILGLLVIEVGLRLTPDVKWKALISKNPTRYVLYQTDKNIGWVHVPGAYAQWPGPEFEVSVQINSHGLRDSEHTYEKPPDTFRILLLGDSFSEGIQVPLEQTFPARLETCLAQQTGQPVEVINTGTASYGPGDELLFFIHEGVKYQPDLVLVAIFAGNDIKNMTRAVDDDMVQAFGGYKFYSNEGHLEKQWLEWAEPDHEISSIERFLRRHINLYYIFNAPDSGVREEFNKFVGRWRSQSSAPEPVTKTSDFPDYAYDEDLMIFAGDFPDNPAVPPSMKELWESFKAALLALQSEVEAHNFPMAVVILPRDVQIHETVYRELASKYQNRYNDPLIDTEWDVTAPNQAIERFLTESGIPSLDLLPGFQTQAETHPDLLYFPVDGHFNEKGHQLAASLMCDWLVENKLLLHSKF